MIKVAIVDQYHGFEDSLIIDLIRDVAPKPIRITAPNQCDLLIIGPHRHSTRIGRAKDVLEKVFERAGLYKRQIKPVVLFQTWENVRYDFVQSDFSISYDLSVASETHFRLPLWMSKIDWSHEGLPVRRCPRFSKPLKIERLTASLGTVFLTKPRRAALFSSHLNEPRRSLFTALSRFMPVDGYGRAFDETIVNHNASGFTKDRVLENFGFNLCPENSLYPGYYTEKIPEAFACDTLPITWADVNVGCDFNPGAFINLMPLAKQGYEFALSQLLELDSLSRHADSPLLAERPSIEPARLFMRKVVSSAM